MDKNVALWWSFCATIILLPQASSHAVLPPTEDKACEKTVADIVFLVDESGRLGFNNFLKVKQFLIDVVGSLKIGENNVRVGVVTFSSFTIFRLHLNKYFDKHKLINAIKNIRYFGGNTNTARALRKFCYTAFAERNGNRIGVSNIAIIVTDGKSSNGKATRKQAAALRDSGVIVFSIGIGMYLRQSELAAMASKPASEYKLTAQYFDATQHITKQITRKICEDSCISKVCQHGGTCKPVAKGLRCICQPQYYGEYCQHKKKCHCNGYGSHHYKTFDEQMIYFPGICKFTLAASTQRAPNYFVVEVKNEYRGNTRLSYTQLVDIKLKGVTIRLMTGNTMIVNGEKKSLPIRNVWGFSARYACGWITVTTSWGLRVQFDGRHRVKVKLNGKFFDKLTGICGDCNGKKDDFRTKQGKDVSWYRNKSFLIGNSYKVKDDSNKPTTKCYVPDVKIYCKSRETRLCNLVKNKIFRKCIGKLEKKKFKEYLKSCQIDVCVYRKNIKHLKSVFCSAIESFAGECAKAGVNVDWRGVAKCPMTCPPRQLYKFATSPCQPSCANPNPKCTGSIEGCVCRKGFILSGNKCVTKSECGCFQKGLYMEANETFLDSKCEGKTICKAGGKLVTENSYACQPNGICSLQNDKRVCVCHKGYYLRNGKCTPKVNKVCEKTVADIVFLVDESGRLGFRNFLKLKQLVIDVVGSLKIGENYVRVGVVTFSTFPFIKFNLNRYFNKQRMIKAIKNIRYFGGYTNTAKALRKIRYPYLIKRNGDRDDAPNIVIVISDGKSSNSKATRKQAEALRDSGAIIYSIGIGKYIRLSEMAAIANKPTSEYNLNVDSFDEMQSLARKIRTKICKEKVYYCNEYGRHHYKMFDGQTIHFPGICKYTLAASTRKAPNYFAVEVKNEHRGNNSVSYTQLIDIKLKGVTIRLMPGNQLLVNGEEISLPIRNVWGFSARYACGWITVTTSWGLNVQFDGRHRVTVKVNGIFFDKLTGICGDCNGKKDDFRTKEGEYVSRLSNKSFLIGNSYKVNDGSDKPTAKCNLLNGKSDCKPQKRSWCNLIKDTIFEKCVGKVGIRKAREYLKSCQTDDCFYRKSRRISKPILCSAIESFAGECAKQGVNVDWRRVANCPKTCPPRQVYKVATPICQPSCSNPYPKCTGLIEGCVCQTGFILSGRKCVQKSECGCFFKGLYMEVNENIIDPKCERKTTCKAGGKLITEMLSPCHPNGICALQNSKRVCICKHGFYIRNGKCTPKAKICPPRQVYKFATPSCQPSCANPNPKCTGWIEGCVCKEGLLRSRNKCVTKSECGCIYKGAYMEINEENIEPKCEMKTICKAGRKLVSENLFPCQPNGICTLRKNKHVCVCKKGFFMLNGKCTSTACDKTVADIVFLLEESGGVGLKNFQKIKQFVVDVVNGLEIGEDDFRIGVVTFSTNTFIKINLNEYFEKQRMISAIKNIGYFGGYTYTAKALRKLRRTVFTKQHGDRIGVPNIVVVVTDGKSSNITATRKQAEALRDSGVEIYSIGIGRYALQSELEAISSKPTSEHKLSVNYFTALQSLTPIITMKICKAEKVYDCVGFGNFHYTTFDGRIVHSQRFSTYTLAASTKKSRYFFTVKIKNRKTRIVEIRLKSVTIRLLPGNDMLVNREQRSFPISNVWGFSVWYSCGWITVSTWWGLSVQFDGIHRVKVKVDSKLFEKLTGICFHGKRKNTNSRTTQKIPLLQSMTSKSTLGPTKKKDSIPPNKKSVCKPYATRRCDVINHQMFRKCIGKLGKKIVEEYLKSCKYVACLQRKNLKLFQTNLCSAIESFAEECAKAGVNVDWRRVVKCPKNCPPRQVYKFAVPICQPSCANPKPNCTGLIEGCVCRKGFILSGNKCVPKTECGCFHNGLYMKANEDIIDTKCERKTTCKAGGKVVSETLAPCQPNGKCTIRKNKRVCVCKRGFVFQQGKCIPKECKKTMKDIVFLLDDSHQMSESSSEKVKQFVKGVITNCNIGANYVRICSVSFSSGVENNVQLYRHFNLNNLLNAIDSIKHRNKTSSVDSVLDHLRTQSFSVAHGDRAGIPNVLVMITDGKYKKEVNILKAAKAIKDSGVTVFVIGVGKDVQRSDLTFLASSPASKFVYTVKNFGDLKEITTKINKRICTVHPCYGRPCKNGGTCERKGETYVCTCKIPFTGKDCTEVAADCKCSAWGDPHYETFDGQLINFMGISKYTLAAPKATCKLPYFAVEVKNEHGGSTRVSYTRFVDLKIKGVTVRLWSDNKLSVNGEIMTLPLTNYMGFSATYSGGWITVTTNFDVQVVFDGRHRIYVKVPGSYREQLIGLCGDCNGLKDDLKTKAGIDVSKRLNTFSLIGQSYEVFDDTYKPQDCHKVVDFINNCPTEETKVCNQLKNPNGPFRKCLRKLGSSAKHCYKSCIIDVCANKNLPKIQKSVMCQSYEALATKCEEIGIIVKWRSTMNCSMKCSKDKVYAESTSRCQPTCVDPTPICPHGPTDGCICKPSTILSGTTCVPMTSCGCTYKGMYRMVGTDLLLKDCSQKITCTAINKIDKKPGCSENFICPISGGQRQCVCKNGYKMSQGKCRPSSENLNLTSHDPKVLKKFARVFVAFLQETAFQKIHAKFPGICAQRCLNDKRCKSFNFNRIKESCELLSINAEVRSLESSDYRYDEYYQLIGFKEIFIRGAEIFSCKNLLSFEGVKTLADCKNKCRQQECKAAEYSQKQARCSITKSIRDSFELMGNDELSYYEII